MISNHTKVDIMVDVLPELNNSADIFSSNQKDWIAALVRTAFRIATSRRYDIFVSFDLLEHCRSYPLNLI